MMVRLFIIMLVGALFLASCGGTAQDSLNRAGSKKGYDYYKASCDVDAVGTPALLRCFVEPDSPDAIEVDSWSWGVSNGRIVKQNADGSVIWVAMDHQGDCTIQARGVDKDGRDCTTPKHRFTSRKTDNAAPIPLPDGPIDGGYGDMPDFNGALVRYHEWRWNTGESYDPEGDPYVEDWTIEGGDLNGDGFPDVVVSKLMGDGSVRTADLDRDGIPDVIVMQSKDDEFVVRVLFRTIKSKEDVYVWKMAIKEQGITARKKEFTGHVTLIK